MEELVAIRCLEEQYLFMCCASLLVLCPSRLVETLNNGRLITNSMQIA